jgi:hypothetical protein
METHSWAVPLLAMLAGGVAVFFAWRSSREFDRKYGEGSGGKRPYSG